MKKAAADVGLAWDDFTLTDNSCKDHPVQTPFPFSLFQKVQSIEAQFEKEMEKDLISFGRGFTVVESGVALYCGSYGAIGGSRAVYHEADCGSFSGILRELSAEEKLVENELKAAGKALEKMEQQYLGKPLAKLGGSS